MNSFSFFVVLCAVISLTCGQFNRYNFFNSGNRLNRCRLNDGSKGTCKPLHECRQALQEMRNNNWPVTCRFQGRNPIVCCEQTSDKIVWREERKSMQKCQQYYRRKNRDWHWFGPAADGLIGGIRASPREFPHMAALGYGDENEIIWACGGSLISPKFVLTAAHCINNRQLGKVNYVRLGDLNINDDSDDAFPQTIKVARRIKHPDYKQPFQYHDIGLLELEEPAEINEYTKPACLQNERHINNPDYIATGWGSTEFAGKPADHLQKVVLYEVSNRECRESFGINRRLIKGIDEKIQICAWEDQKDTCQGDSGGPLQVRNKEFINGYTVIGITSFGKACGISNTAGVYTRVSHYIDWIESIVWPDK